MNRFFSPNVSKSKEKQKGWGKHRAGRVICFCRELCPQVFRPQWQPSQPSSCKSGREQNPEAAAENTVTGRVALTLCPHLTRNEPHALLSRNTLVAVITCPCALVSFETKYYIAKMWWEAAGAAHWNRRLCKEISVRYMFFQGKHILKAQPMAGGMSGAFRILSLPSGANLAQEFFSSWVEKTY